MDRFESMSAFVAVAETGGFSAASRRLRMPLATLSRKVSELETTLGVTLVNRSTRKITLTDAGRCYAAACQRILSDMQEAERAAAGEYTAPKGELIVTAPIVFGRLHVLPIAIEFLKAYPEIDLRLAFLDRVVNLLEERVDLAVRISPLPSSSLIATHVGHVRQIVCCSPAYAQARGAPTSLDVLSSHDCITFEGLSRRQSWTFRTGKNETVVAVRSRLSVSTSEAAIDGAIAGLGLTRVLSYQAARAMREKTLMTVLDAFADDPIPVNLVYTAQTPLPLKLRAFLDFAAPRLRRRLPDHLPD